MGDSEKPPSGPPESPTTARELDFDDDDVAASPKPPKAGAAAASESTVPHSTSEALAPAPAQPPRPMSPREQAETTLREAFPGIEASVVKAVLVASGGQVEPAFNALLGMSDPDAQQAEPAPPPPPPRPVAAARSPVGRTQLEQDEIYARRLAEHYNSQDTDRDARREVYRDSRGQGRGQRSGVVDNEDAEEDKPFLDDDFAAIRDGIKKGFVETQSKVNSFITSLRKRIDGEDEDEEPPPQPPRRPLQQYGSRRSGDMSRRSGDRDRYDADPEVLGDDFTELQMRDDTIPQRRAGRPAANPDLFKPTPMTPQSNNTRRVSFQEGPPEEITDSHLGTPDPTKRPSSTNSKSKWQPLATVDPNPVADHDPFSLGDSDEEESNKKKDVKPEDTERLKKATAEAMAEDLGTGETHKDGVEAADTTSPAVAAAATKDVEPEEKLASGKA